MRNFRPALGVLAVFLLLVLGADSEAGRRCRQTRCCNTYCAIDACAIPSCVPWVNRFASDTMPCPDGYECKCCSGGSFVLCGSASSCDTGTMCCVQIGSDIQLSCARYGGGGCSYQGPTTNPPVLWGMLGDNTTKKLRYAHIDQGEKVEVYAPQHMLGWGFTRRPK